jgi:hypothetical protein
MTLDELQKHATFTGLSKQQKLYVVARCLGKDKIEAAKEAWQCANDASAEASANRADRNGNIKWCIQEFQGGNLPTRDDVIKQAWEISKAASDFNHKINALKLVANLSGFEAAPPTPPTPKNDADEDFPVDEG